MVSGYWRNPEGTAQCCGGEGWLRTGDLAVIDGEGEVEIVDRLKEVMKIKGWQVVPAELEAILVTHPGIADAAVVP